MKSRTMRKIVSVVLALVLVMSMSSTVFAADGTYSITINNPAPGHTYEVYQIFKGDLHEGTLSNIEWGTGVDATGLGDAAAKAKTIETAADAKAFAREISAKLTNPAKTVKQPADSNEKCVIEGLTPGYYLIKDGTLPEGEGQAKTAYILEVVKNVETNIKSSVPSVDKEVKEYNDSVSKDGEYKNYADYDIGDTVEFKLTATLGTTVDTYDTYKVVFHDTLSAGLTYNENSAKVMFEGTDVTGNFEITHNNGILTLACDNVKAFKATNGSVITVEYTATLNDKAVIGGTGNVNTVTLEFSNDPNNSQAGKDNPTGTTPEDKVVVFTYKTVINKVNEEKNPLTGAEFKLEKKMANDTWVEIDRLTVNGEKTQFTFTGLDDGTYRLTETKTPDGYNTIDPITFTIDATHTLTGSAIVIDGITATVDNNAGSITADIVNEKGSILPSTGGMGTTLLYALGALLIVGAGTTLAIRRRRAEEN